MSVIDTSKTAEDNLLALVTAANPGVAPTDAQVTLSAPVVKADSGDGRNTTVTISAVSGQGFVNSKDVNYKRRPLNDSVITPDFASANTIGDTAASIITAIAEANGLVASELELQDPANGNAVVTGAIENSPATLTLALVGTSLLYLPGSTQAITFTWTAPPTDLSTAIANADLDGFDAAS